MNSPDRVRIPIPGRPVRGSRSGAPIMALFDLLGRRWSMGVLWTLASSGPCNFRDLQARCESISPAVLNARLKELRAAKFIDHGGDGYFVLPRGNELYDMLVPLGAWSKSWGKEVAASAGKRDGGRPAEIKPPAKASVRRKPSAK